MQTRNITISIALSVLGVLVVALVPATAAGDCPYETRLADWQQAEDNQRTSTEALMRPGVAMIVDHITVCRNGSAVFLRGQAGTSGFAVRFIRANQDSFQDVLHSRFVVEKRVSFGNDPEQPSLSTDADGRMMLRWKQRSTEIVGEHAFYFPPDESYK